MNDVLAAIPLVGWGPQLVLGGLALLFLVLAVVLWRRHKVWRWVLVFLFLVFGLATAGDVVNTKFSYFDTMADLLGVPTYPTGTIPDASGGTAGGGGDVTPHPQGAVVAIDVPDPASGFGTFQAQVWLPPQYFTDTRTHFPVVYLLHGDPGRTIDWVTSGGAATTALSVAQSGKPVILVMPEDLQNELTGDSLCVDTASQGNAETYLTKDVLAAVDGQLRTDASAKGRAIGGLSMGGYCALNLGLKHPDLYSVVLDFSGDTSSLPDLVQGGNQALYGGPDWQAKADANSPSKYVSKLDGSKGPAIYLGSGSGDPTIIAQMSALLPQLQAKGFTVEFRQLPGAHEYGYWTAALKDALPWAAQRLG